MTKDSKKSKGKYPKVVKGVSTFSGCEENMPDEPNLPESSEK